MNSVLSMFTPEFANEHPDLLAEREKLLYATPPASRGLVGHYEADIRHDSRGRLRQIAAPTLVTYGTRDTAALPAYNQAVIEQIPAAEVYVFEGAGHLTFSEFPEQFNSISLDFLARHPL
jgi:pimeloyl-ACP methyl ester carboxylesterase